MRETGRKIWRKLLCPAAIAAGAVVLFELLRVAFVSVADVGSSLAFGLGVAGVLGLPLALAGAAVLAAAAAAARGWRWALSVERLDRAQVAAALLFASVSAVAIVFAATLAMERVAHFARPVYQGLAIGVVAALVAVAATVVAGPAVAALSRAVRRGNDALPTSLAPLGAGWWLWLALATAIVVLLPTVLFGALGTVDLRPPRLVVAWLAALVFAVRASASYRTVASAASIALLLWFAAGYVFAAGWLGDDPRRAAALSRDTVVAGSAAKAITALFDRDGDGAGALFLGGDCDDDNPLVGPGVFDTPDDGIDQNCTGDDMRVAFDPVVHGQHADRPPPTGIKRHVILITIDALRTDAADQLMPNLSALRRESADFRAAYAHAAATYWSLSALLTSKLPTRIAYAGNGTPLTAEVTLTDALRDAGYHTAMFSGVHVFFENGFRQAFHHANFDATVASKDGHAPGAEALVDIALAYIGKWKRERDAAGRDEPLFLWTHLFDPHAPYFEVPGFAADGRSDRARYDAIVRYTDAELGRLLAGLDAAGLDDAVVVVTSDHGEEFGDHGHRYHGKTLYEEVVRVPLVVRVPGGAGVAIATPVGHRDVGPTVLELAGVPTPEQFTGRSHAATVLSGAAIEPAPVFFEIPADPAYDERVVGARVGKLKIISNVSTGQLELYDLTTDPLERDNIVGRHPDSDAMIGLIGAFTDHHLYWLALGNTIGKRPVGSPELPRR